MYFVCPAHHVRHAIEEWIIGGAVEVKEQRVPAGNCEERKRKEIRKIGKNRPKRQGKERSRTRQRIKYERQWKKRQGLKEK
jgi:hypothetical protein